MYNIYKHQEYLRQQEEQLNQEQNYAKWMLNNQKIKKISEANVKKRVSQFVKQQNESPRVIEDDHYRTWRYNKQFRDVENQDRFVGFKTFRHKPNQDMDKYFTERERKQIKYLGQKASPLIQSKIIPEQLRNRSLRSQGPLNKTSSFRSEKPSLDFQQPRMRYTNVTDKQRLNESKITYDDKFKKTYNSFSLGKTQIGFVRVSPKKDNQDSHVLDSLSSAVSENKQKNKNPYYFQVLNEEDRPDAANTQNSFKMSLNENAAPSKTYFKTAKTHALYGDKQAHNLMINSQYDRKKDLSNLSRNKDNESFMKKPIL